MSLDSSPSNIPAGDRASPESTSRLKKSNNNVDDDLNPNPNAASQNEDRFTQNDTTTTAPPPPLTRSNRPSRACTIRAAARLSQSQQQVVERKPKPKKEQRNDEVSPQQQQQQQCSRIVMELVGPPPPSQLPRWSLRSMWELASVLNFLHVFRPLLNISIEFSAEEFETTLITPNDTLSDIHMPLLKAIPPITRMALTRDTWVTVLCRKLRDWWHWVADGDLPIVASHGAEVEVYKTLEPEIRVTILKALCDIRVEQEDIRTYIEKSLKHGVQLSAFRKERIGGDSQGINYWYEDDPIIGHRLYREIRKVEAIKAKTKGSRVNPSVTYQWETVATNFDEFQDVSEKLFSSKNRTEASLGKKVKNDMLLEIEKVHKRKEKLLKKQHRQALLLDNYVTVDGLGPGRSLRDRKPVTYTFDAYDRSINEAIKITKRKPPSPEPNHRREILVKPEPSTTNGQWSASSPATQNFTSSGLSPESPDYDDDTIESDHHSEPVDRSNRRRQRPQRYSEKEFVEADFDSDDDIVGEAIYDEEYLRKRKQRRTTSSSSEGDDEYHYEEENGEDEEEEEEEEDEYSLSMSDEESDQPQKLKKLPDRSKRTVETAKLRSVGDVQLGLRRSKRASRNQVNYRQYELSESESEPGNKNNNNEPEKSNNNNAMGDFMDGSENGEYSTGSRDSRENDDRPEVKIDQQPIQSQPEIIKEGEQNLLSHPQEKLSNNCPLGPTREQAEVVEGVRKRRFLDLNKLAPASAFDDGLNNVSREDDDDNTDHF